MATKTDQGTKKVCIRLTDSSDLSSIHSSWWYSSCTVSSFFPYQKGKVWIPGFHISSYPRDIVFGSFSRTQPRSRLGCSCFWEQSEHCRFSYYLAPALSLKACPECPFSWNSLLLHSWLTSFTPRCICFMFPDSMVLVFNVLLFILSFSSISNICHEAFGDILRQWIAFSFLILEFLSYNCVSTILAT